MNRNETHKINRNSKYFTPTLAYSYLKYKSNHPAITEMLNYLKDKRFVDNKTSFQDFKKIFNNENPSKPVVWLGDITDLAFFIKLLHLTYKVIEKIPHDIWKVTDTIFIDKYGQQFGWKRFRHQKSPADKSKLQKAVKFL